MTKRNSGSAKPNDAEASREPMKTIYTAHQVHTLAQLIFQHWVGSRQASAPQGAGAPFVHPNAGQPGRWGWPPAVGAEAGPVVMPHPAGHPGWFHW